MLNDNKTKEQLAEEYLKDIMGFIKDGKIHPENLKDAYSSGYLRGYIDALLKDIETLNTDIRERKWYKEDA